MSEATVSVTSVPITLGRKPPWLKVRARSGPNVVALRQLVREQQLHTVCQEAGCPNLPECWQAREATFLLGGEHCTRACRFCRIDSSRPTGYDEQEPLRVAQAVAEMGLRFAVLTSVARDDLADGGAWLFAESVRQIRARIQGCGVEVLIPDFRGHEEPLAVVTDALPDVLGHNIETVPRLYRTVRPGFRYERTLELLRRARASLPDAHATKSNIILGFGERLEEVTETLADLRSVGVDLVTISQYLQPSAKHLPLTRYVTPEEFAELGRRAEGMGFAHVESGPLVRSSYHAGEMHRAAVRQRTGKEPAWMTSQPQHDNDDA